MVGIFFRRPPVEPRTLRDIGFDSYDRLYAPLHCFLIEGNDAIHHTMIRDSQCIEPALYRRTYEIGNPGRPVQQRVFGMVMKVNEGNRQLILHLDCLPLWQPPKPLYILLKVRVRTTVSTNNDGPTVPSPCYYNLPRRQVGSFSKKRNREGSGNSQGA